MIAAVAGSRTRVWLQTEQDGRVWFDVASTELFRDGSYVLELPYAEDRELLMEIMKHGPDVEVLGPESLRSRAAQSLAQAADRYRGR